MYSACIVGSGCGGSDDEDDDGDDGDDGVGVGGGVGGGGGGGVGGAGGGGTGALHVGSAKQAVSFWNLPTGPDEFPGIILHFPSGGESQSYVGGGEGGPGGAWQQSLVLKVPFGS